MLPFIMRLDIIKILLVHLLLLKSWHYDVILGGIWIVSSEWLRRSVETGHVHKEVNYEVISCVKATKPKAPARARCARNRLDKNGWTVENKGPFAGLVVCLYGDYPLPQPPRSQLQFLLNYGGAVCCKLEEFMEIFNSAVVSTVKIASNRKSHFVSRVINMALFSIFNLAKFISYSSCFVLMRIVPCCR